MQRRVIRQKYRNVSKELIASTFRVEEYDKKVSSKKEPAKTALLLACYSFGNTFF
jgi:hypothetical protein